MSRTVSILEYVTNGTPCKVDREAGIIADVKVLGQKSANGRRYLPEAIERARGLYEGKAVNANHPAKGGDPRSAYDRVGWLEGIYLKDGDLYAKRLHYLKAHPLAGALTEAAERRPELFGLSHNARGKEKRVNGEAVIESIDSVSSVDLVADPASTKGLHESRTMFQTLAQLLETLKGTPQGVTLKEMADAAGMPSDAPMDAPAASSPDDAIKSGFKAAIHAVVDDDSMDMQAKLAKIKDILKAQEKLMGGDKKPDAPAEGDKPAAEARKPDQANLQEQLARLERKDRARDLCEAAGVKPSTALLKALCALSDEADVKALVEEAKSASAGAAPTPQSWQKPRSQGPTAAKPLVEVKIPEKADDWARSLVE